ncbi:sigma 54-interacting transcriptional regulator [Desulfotomaculum copahuensis]|uniref:sigma 54-interacting transcriptional regulator n=1 Tax=Desulfotomaculum copahuensis TaxID=1838280 RepID=UPI000B18848F|nr:sigma 54-interacting transcriptional regulator [Desulfotomaculum copahuensis]
MSHQEFVIQIDFRDRPGLGYDIFELFEKNNIDKISMEAVPEKGMMIKFRSLPGCVNKLFDELKKVDGVLGIRFREHMPYEEREHELRTILNSVSEGIVAINREGKITHINEVACRILHSSVDRATGQDVEELFRAEPPLLTTLKSGKSHSLKECKINTGNKIIRFLTSDRPVLNDRGQIIGAVSTIKDYRQVEEILSRVERSRAITFDSIIHHSPAMKKLVETAKIVARGSSTILLRGESGTGKELFARAIHHESSRASGPFIAVNCAALPDTLLESELFGYEEGAFTGANRGGKKGLFENARRGTLFLDEIGEISPQMQVRLLRVLQEGTIRRVGGAKEIPVDVRILAATHRDLEEMIERGEFREDLYYRLNVIPLKIPPLRERKEDIPIIAQHLLRNIAVKHGKKGIHLTRESLELLMSLPWPGNVRQLENMLERIVNVTDVTEVNPDLLYEWEDLCRSKFNGSLDNKYFSLHIPVNGEWPPLKDIVAQVEKQVLEKVLKTCKSSRQAGRVLGVSNTTILNKMKKYGLEQ